MSKLHLIILLSLALLGCATARDLSVMSDSQLLTYHEELCAKATDLSDRYQSVMGTQLQQVSGSSNFATGMNNLSSATQQFAGSVLVTRHASTLREIAKVENEINSRRPVISSSDPSKTKPLAELINDIRNAKNTPSQSTY